MTVIERPNVDYGDGETARDNEILRTLVGSGVHGMAVEGTDDRDEMGIFIEPPQHVMGAAGPLEQHVWRTQPEGVRSGPGDVDLTIYSLRKYMRLALAGNPTILLPLYAPESEVLVCTVIGDELRALTGAIVSRKAGQKFLGYLDQQHLRMHGGGRQSRVPKRPELIERFGFDVKYASHALRLSFQGVELMETGRLSLPMRDDERSICVALKTGRMTFNEADDVISQNRQRLAEFVDGRSSPLRPDPDFERINAWMVNAHRGHWGWS